MSIMRCLLLTTLFTIAEVHAQLGSSTTETNENVTDPVYQGTILQQPFKIGVGVRSDDLKTDMCTVDEKKFMNEKFAEYTVALARLFFRDDTVQLTGNFTEADRNDFDRFAFDDFNTYEKQKFDNAQVESSAKLPPANPEANTASGGLGFLKVDPADVLDATNASDINSYPPQTDTLDATPWNTCQTKFTRRCVTVNFDEALEGIPLTPGQYVTDEYKTVFGLSISVKAIGADAFTPEKQGTGLKAARLFDSSEPSKEDSDLGSPNEECNRKDKGPGKGEGGKPDKKKGKEGNCEPQGNVLIIQQSHKKVPTAATMGGEVTFKFDRPVEFNSIGLMNIEKSSVGIEVVKDNGNEEVIKGINALGKNSVQDVLVGKTRVRKLVLYMPEKGAVTHLNYCLQVCDEVWDINVGKNYTTADTSGRNVRHKRQLRSRTSTESAGIIDLLKEQEYDTHNRRLATSKFRFMFIYGGQNEYTCSFCTASLDRRNRELSNGNGNVNGNGSPPSNEREYLIAALESVMSFGLTMDLGWSVKYFLKERNIDYGCFGDGDSISVVFELEESAAIE